MPRPPAERFSNPAEADFDWAMDRLNHAIEMFHPPSSLGIRVTRDMDYELFPPNAEHSNYTARVTVTTKTIYVHGKPVSPSKNRREAQEKAKKQKAEEQAERDPFALPGEEPITGTTTIDDEIAQIDQDPATTIDPSIPPQEIELKEEFDLEYKDGTWKQLNRAEEEHIQLWFDYALQQGEYKPESLEK
ncbi:hypothetical protein [Bythopirellula goksoeyrii]|nr:hypothetical protein [Bythopirellula goksoeyrii]